MEHHSKRFLIMHERFYAYILPPPEFWFFNFLKLDFDNLKLFFYKKFS